MKVGPGSKKITQNVLSSQKLAQFSMNLYGLFHRQLVVKATKLHSGHKLVEIRVNMNEMLSWIVVPGRDNSGWKILIVPVNQR